MAYIANRPVRFDRNYAIGEVIPDAVIAPGMARRLVEMGRILCVELPGKENAAGKPAKAPQEGGAGTQGTNTQAGEKIREGGAQGGTDAQKSSDGEPGSGKAAHPRDRAK